MFQNLQCFYKPAQSNETMRQKYELTLPGWWNSRAIFWNWQKCLWNQDVNVICTCHQKVFSVISSKLGHQHQLGRECQGLRIITKPFWAVNNDGNIFSEKYDNLINPASHSRQRPRQLFMRSLCFKTIAKGLKVDVRSQRNKPWRHCNVATRFDTRIDYRTIRWRDRDMTTCCKRNHFEDVVSAETQGWRVRNSRLTGRLRLKSRKYTNWRNLYQT